MSGQEIVRQGEPFPGLGLRRERMWRALGWGLVVAVIAGSLWPTPPEADVLPSFDKVVHFGAYAVLMFWFGQLHPAGRQRAVLGLGFAAMGAALEVAQGFIGSRSPEIGDIVANGVGVLLGWALVLTPLRRSLQVLDSLLAAK